MKFIAIALAAFLLGTAEAKTQQYWTCTDAAGNKAAQDFPCPVSPAVPAPQVVTEPTVESPKPQAPPAQAQVAPRIQPKPATLTIALVDDMLRPLLSLFWMLVVVLVMIWAFRRKTPAKAVRQVAKPGTLIGPDGVERIQASGDLLLPVPKPRPTKWSFDLIQRLEWKRFEEACAGYWQAKNYRAELTGKGADGGVDVNLYSPTDPTRLIAIVQCKAQADQVGVEKVRELWGVANHLGVKMALFYGRSGYTDSAKEFAAGKHLKLFTGRDLFTQILALPAEQQAALLDHVTRDDYTTPTCPQCDVKMTLRESKKDSRDRSKFWGCVNYPKCHQTFHLNIARPDL